MSMKPVEQQSLKWPFVGLSALLLLATVWAVFDEVVARRPWKEYQREFFALEESHLRQSRERAQKRLQSDETKKELDGAQAELRAAQDAISGSAEQRRAYEAAVKAEQDAAGRENDAKLYLGFSKSEQDAIYYRLREARHDGRAQDEAKLQKQLDDKQREVDAKAAAYEAALARHKAATAAKLAFLQRLDAAKAKVDAFEKPVRELDKRLESYAGLGRFPQMEQYWITGLRNSWGSPTVDRCQNCHMGIDRSGFSAPWEVLEAKKKELPEKDFRAQYSIDAELVEAYQQVYGRICEDVPEQPAAVPFGGWTPPAAPPAPDVAAATECRPRAVFEKWLEMGAAYCGPKNRALAKAKLVWKDAANNPIADEKRAWTGVSRNPAKDALAGHDDRPRWERASLACGDKDTVAALEEAAKLDPFDVKPVFRTHPYRIELLAKSHPTGQFGCTTCHGGEGPQTKGVAHRKFRHGEDDPDWNDPLTEEVTVMGKKYPGAFLQAKCDKCHGQELTVEHAPLLAKGKKLFTDVGCWGCHPMDGYNELPKRGPALTNIASKTTPAWLETWIAYPKAWRPATRMPNFWPGAVDPDAVLRRDGQKDEDVLAGHRKLRDEEVAAISAYLWQSADPLTLETPPAGDAAKGKAIFDAVGCRACHVAEKGSAARRSEASGERDYAPNLWNIADKAKPAWLYAWVKNPKSLWADTKMPDLRLSNAEAANVTAFLLTLKSDQRYPEPKDVSDRTLAERGKALIGKYGCAGCHAIQGFENAQKIGTELNEHGRKSVDLLDFGDVKYFTEDPKRHQTYANWVWEKLHTPHVFAYERVETRMPQYDFTDDEALSILTFLKAQTGEKPERRYLTAQDDPKAAVARGERLVFWNGCRQCHVIEKRGGVARDLYAEDTLSFAPPNLGGEGAKVQPAWLFGFLKAPAPLRPWLSIRMPTFHFSDHDAGELVHFFAAADNKSFPYVTNDASQLTGAKLAQTAQLFRTLQCMKCHPVGELRPDQDPSTAAPNLLLAKERLRPDWVPQWLKNPQALMDGTRMPSFWDFSDEQHPTTPTQDFGGDAVRQIEALSEYLMHLELPTAGDKTAAAARRRR